MPKKKAVKAKQMTAKELEKAQAKHAEWQEKHDSEVKTRTSKYDQDIKERARKLAINPDNFATEDELRKAVQKLEGAKDE